MPKFPVDVATERCSTPQFVSPGEHDGSSDSPGAYLLVGGAARRTVPPINSAAPTEKAITERKELLTYLIAFFFFSIELFCKCIIIDVIILCAKYAQKRL